MASDVEHAVDEVADVEGVFGDAGGLHTRSEDVLVGGEVIGLGDAVDCFKVAVSR